MATQLIPEGAPTTSTPTTTPPEAPPTEAPKTPIPDTSRQELMEVYDQVIAGKDRELREAQERLRQLEAASNAKPLEDDQNAIFTRPRDLIREEVRKEIAPLVDFVKTFRQESATDILIRKYALDPRFKDVWPTIEPYIRRTAAAIPDFDDQKMITLVLGAVGAYHSGFFTEKPTAALPSPTPTTPTPTTPTLVTPPHLRPSAPPPALPPSDQPKRRELNELEKRLAREHNMTPEQYLDYLEMKPAQVAVKKEGK